MDAFTSGEPPPPPLRGTPSDRLSKQTTNRLMRFSPATRLADRQTIWVAYRNDGTCLNRLGHPATTWAAHFAEAHADEVAPCPISGWKY